MAGMSAYVRALLPDTLDKIDFLYKADFNGDGVEEGLVGYTYWDRTEWGEQLVFTALYIDAFEQGYTHLHILSTASDPDSLYDQDDDIYGLCDYTALADTTGDRRPELVIGLTAGNGHFVTPLVFHWVGGKPVLAWRTEEAFAHGRLEVDDADGDRVYEMIVEEAVYSDEDEIIAASEAGPHVRQRTVFKWDGTTYQGYPYPDRPDYREYNTAAAFLVSVWKGDYRAAYDLALLPRLLGVEGLDDSSLEAFIEYVDQDFRPALLRNLDGPGLRPEKEMPCGWAFSGKNDTLVVELADDRGAAKVASVGVIPRTS